MRFSVDAAALKDAVKYVARLLPGRPTAPVYAGIRLTANTDGNVSVSVFDPGQVAFVSATVEAKVEEGGEILLLGRRLAELVALASGEVSFAVDGPAVRVTTARTRYVLGTMPLDEYQVPAFDAGEVRADVPLAEFALAISRVSTVAVGDALEMVPILAAVAFEHTANELTVTATDRYRLATETLAFPGGGEWSTLIPAKALADAVKGLDKAETVEVNVSAEGALRLRTETRHAVIYPLEGQYPAWRALLPKVTTTAVTLDAPAALAALTRVAIMGEVTTPVVVEFGEGTAVLHVETEGLGASRDELDVALEGEPVTARFNARYLRDGLAACGDTKVTLSMSSPTRPVLIEAQGTRFRYLVVPIRA